MNFLRLPFLLVLLFGLVSELQAQNKVNPSFSNGGSSVTQGDRSFETKFVDEVTLKFLNTVVNNKADLVNNDGVEAFRAKNYPLAVEQFKKAIVMRPTFMEAKLNLAATYIAQKEYDQALEVYQLMELENQNPAEVSVMKGQVELARGNFEQAIANFDRAIGLDSTSASTFHAIGNAYLKINATEKAIAHYSKAIEMDGVSAFYTDRASAHLKQKDYREAISDYEKALSVDGKNVRAMTNRGKAYFELQEYEKALADFDRALKLDARYLPALINRAATKNFLKDYKGAMEDCSAALEIDGKHPLALLNQGIVKSRLGDVAGACKDWSRAKDNGNEQAGDYLKKYCDQ